MTKYNPVTVIHFFGELDENDFSNLKVVVLKLLYGRKGYTEGLSVFPPWSTCGGL